MLIVIIIVLSEAVLVIVIEKSKKASSNKLEEAFFLGKTQVIYLPSPFPPALGWDSSSALASSISFFSFGWA